MSDYGNHLTSAKYINVHYNRQEKALNVCMYVIMFVKLRFRAEYHPESLTIVEAK